MKKVFTSIALLFPYLLLAQNGEFFLKMPKKYETPFQGMSTSIDNAATEKVWYVIAAKNDVPVYSDEACQNLTGKIAFLKYMAVLKESENAVFTIEKAGEGALTRDFRFTNLAVSVGWIKKSDLVLWERSLLADHFLVKALLRKAPDNSLLPGNMPGFTGRIDPTGYGVYNVLKIEPNAWLLCKNDMVHEGLTNEDVFWVDKTQLTRVMSNRAYVPDWNRVSEGLRMYLYGNIERALSVDTSNASMKIYRNNPFTGYLHAGTQNGLVKLTSYLPGYPDTLFFKSSDAGFRPANLVDNNQFTVLMNIMKFLSNSSQKEILKYELTQFFNDQIIDIKDQKYANMSVAELLGYAMGLDFSGYVTGRPVFIDDIDDLDMESWYNIFGTNYERFLSENEIGKYRFFSGIAYYWLPHDFLALDILSKITLSKTRLNKIQTSKFSEFTVFYIDHSSENKPYEQLNAEIIKMYSSLNTIWSKESESTETGHLIYYSSGVDPLITQGEEGFNQVTGLMRNASTIRPDRFFDKLRLENELFSKVEAVSGKITLNFDVSDNFYQSEIESRSYFFKEFVERMNTIISGNETTIQVNLFCPSRNNATMSLLEDYCKKMNQDYRNIKFTVFKFM